MRQVILMLWCGALACAPALPPCSPTSCEGGCCDARGVCVAGRTRAACGLTGNACNTCVGEQQCLGGLCAVPAPDAGQVEPDAGPPDAGPEPDAGRRRTVRIRYTRQRLLADASVIVEETDPHQSNVVLFFERDGEWMAAPPETSGGLELRIPDVPEGDYLIRRGTEYLQSTSDEVELGFRSVGRRLSFVAPGTPLTIALSDIQPGLRPGDVIALTSFNSGGYLDSYFIPTSTPDASVGQWSVDYGTVTGWGTSLSGDQGDEVTILLKRASNSDAGVQGRSAAFIATQRAPEFDTGRPATIMANLQPLSGSRKIGVEARFSDFAQYIGDVSPTATFSLATVAVASLPRARPVGTGRFDGRSAALFETFIGGTPTDFRAPIEFQDAFPGMDTLVEARLGTNVTFTLSGRSLTANLETFRMGRTDGGVLGLDVSPVRFIRINGQTANVQRNGVGTSPLIEWAQPAVGRPNRYLVTIWRLTAQGTTLVQSFVGRVITTVPRVRLPPGGLRPGDAYYAIVFANTFAEVDPQRTPFWEDADTGRASAVTAPFTP